MTRPLIQKVDAERALLELVASAAGYLDASGTVHRREGFGHVEVVAHPDGLAELRSVLKLGGRGIARRLRAEARSGNGYILSDLTPDTHEAKDYCAVLDLARSRARPVWRSLTGREWRTLDAAAQELGLSRCPLLD